MVAMNPEGRNPSRGRRDTSGQYMVEFALSLIIFVAVTIGVVELMLMGYDFNLAQRASWEAARKTAIGQSNTQINDFVDTMLVQGWISGMALVTHPTFTSTTLVTPNNQMDRVEGKEAQVNFGFTFGLVMPGLSQFTTTIPVRSRLVITAKNDEDRDGIHDAVGDPSPGDHDDDGVTDGVDTDDDGDGWLDAVDSALITTVGTASTTVTNFGILTFAITDDNFHCPVFYQLSGGRVQREPLALFPRMIPRDRYAANGNATIVTLIDLSFDEDNDRYEDKFDAAPTDPMVQ